MSTRQITQELIDRFSCAQAAISGFLYIYTGSFHNSTKITSKME
jgi:hypothetical protein